MFSPYTKMEHLSHEELFSLKHKWLKTLIELKHLSDIERQTKINREFTETDVNYARALDIEINRRLKSINHLFKDTTIKPTEEEAKLLLVLRDYTDKLKKASEELGNVEL